MFIRQEVYPFIFLPQQLQVQFSSATRIMHLNTADTINNIDITNSISIDDNNESQQLFEEYKSVLHDALEIDKNRKMLITFNGHKLFKGVLKAFLSAKDEKKA
ncbi:2909_t:CDS:2 [Gigaspora margarita]|uniref:2909_t:CDS:1 n=1 Tax=Gigaspora margarita TaxID=4874 RepID=A0ABN7VBL9_GIGMA|nr:2909_t:CDS:2 [Gigaspora margarita]